MFHTQTKLFSWISPYVEYFYLFWGHLAGLWLCDVYFESWPICGPKPGYQQRDTNNLVVTPVTKSSLTKVLVPLEDIPKVDIATEHK